MKTRRLSILLLIIIAGAFLVINFNKGEYIRNQGLIHGTIYHFIYNSPDKKDLQSILEQEMHQFDNSLSTFVPSSTISKINSNTDMSTDSLFEVLYKRSVEISDQTDGAFDMTVAPLVNEWGFGYETSGDSTVSKQIIDSLLQFTGYEMVHLVDHKITKDDPRIKLDASAIAKGFSVDMVANLLEKYGVKDYMVEIGGEIRVKGKNPKGHKWVIGIDKPIDDPTVSHEELLQTIDITNKAIATSGNYRNFYVKDGVKYSHTIDPATGYPVHHNLLSATVIADDCMTADAFATACMVSGVEKSLTFAKMNKNLDIFLIYSDENGDLKTASSNNFDAYLSKE
ncbi:FAD:protein FMN transferase [Saccharicrinis sp. FJH62]|uniref:FAD:protein FMN transferase n=1 Tax=Saccharicrinis sp. FJH62 TaxID=3344657 RepID=UPI0035D4CAF9